MSEDERALVQIRAVSRGLTVSTVEAPLVRQSERASALFPRWPVEADAGSTRSVVGRGGIFVLALAGLALRSGSATLGVALYFAGSVALLQGVWAGGGPRLRRWFWWRRDRRRAFPLVASVEGRRDGDLVRTTGTVQADSLFESAVTGGRAVLGRYTSRVRDHYFQAVDFVVSPDGGGAFRVGVRGEHCVLLEDPAGNHGSARAGELLDRGGFFDPQLGEILVGPGDRVEVVGTLRLEVDPEGRSDGPRAPRMRPRLVAGRGPVLVRRLPLDPGSR